MVKIYLMEPANGTQTSSLQQNRWPMRNPAMSAIIDLPITWDNLTESSPDRTVPRPVTFAWEVDEISIPDIHYDLFLATKPDFYQVRCISDIATTEIKVYHLKLATTYYWKVIAKCGEQPVASSPTWMVTTSPDTPRWIHVPGMTNVRDLGGWPLPGGGAIRQGMVYRTSEMNVHLHITDEGKRILLDDLEICCDLDLREEAVACPALDASRVRWVNIPISPYQAICADIPYGQTAYRRIFSFLANPEHYPLVFHCWGGADRAGTVAFLLGALLGMSLDQLIQDYELTSLSVWGPRSRFSLEFTDLLACLRPFSADAEDITAQVAGYLTVLGVTESEIAAIRNLLIIPMEACVG